MRTIYKYVFEVTDEVQTLELPVGHRMLSVGPDPVARAVALWAEVETEADTMECSFRVYGTGWPVKDGEIYLGTAVIGPFVWHLYEVV